MTTQFRSTFTVKRKEPGEYVKGIWEEGSFETFNIQASVQPMRGKEMEELPEGRRNSEAVKFYTATELKTVNESNPDILLAFNNEYEVQTVEKWQSKVISHYKCIGIKL